MRGLIRALGGEGNPPRWIGADVEPGRFLEGERVSWRIAPFVAAGVLPFALIPVVGVALTDPRVLIAAALIPVIIALALNFPWERYPAWAQAILPMAYFVIVALLRDAAGGPPTVFDALVIIPVAWFAIYGTGRELALSIVAMGMTLALPVLLVGEPNYDDEQITRAAVAVLLVTLIGPTVQALVIALRRLTFESRAVIASAHEAFVSMDGEGRITEWNPEAERLFGWPREEALGRTVAETLVPERYRDDHGKGLRRFLDTGEGPLLARRFEIEGLRRDGTEVPVELTISALRYAEQWHFQAFLHDVSERRRSEEALRDAEERFRRAFDDNRVGMALVAPDGSFLRVNQALSEITGRPADELTGMRFAEITHPEDLEPDQEALREMIEGERYGYRTEKRYIHARGHPVWISLNVSPVRDADGNLLYMISQMEDISERKETEARLTRQALHDSLTGLPNRALFADRVRVASARRNDGAFAVIYMDLDGFKLVNDTLGHAAGDQVLMEVGRRLERVLRAGDTLARLGGDEFAILCEEVTEHDVKVIVDRVVDAMGEPVEVMDRSVQQAASIGVALYPRHGAPVDPEAVIGDADLAMYRAKATGKSRYAVFERWMREGERERGGLERELREALGRDELTVHYQPEVDLRTGAITGAEALVRWQHPERGLLEPPEFLFLAESSDLIVEIDDLVLRTACAQAADWRPLIKDGEAFTVSVNVSQRRLADPELSAKIAQAISDAGIPASTLCLEIAERAVMDRRAVALSAVPGLEALGIRLLIDDFGVAITSFGSLNRLPQLTAVKIDASFIAGLGRSSEDAAGVAAIIGLAHGLKLTATAEGVERAEQMHELRALHCDRALGYYFARPQPPGGMADLLESARLGELTA